MINVQINSQLEITQEKNPPENGKQMVNSDDMQHPSEGL
jgi:hypothetical protein